MSTLAGSHEMISYFVIVTIYFSFIGLINAQPCKDCPNDLCSGGVCKICSNTCPDGYYRRVAACVLTTQEITPTATNTAALPAPAVTSLSLAEPVNLTVSTESTTLTTTQPTTKQFNVICDECPMDNCTACNSNTSCYRCTSGYRLTTNGTCLPEDNKNEGSKAAIIGGAVGGAIGGLVLIGLIILAVVCLRRRQASRNVHNTPDVEEVDGPQGPEGDGTETSTKLELKEDIQRTHERITRYVRDPTEKISQKGLKDPETDELYNLPEAPPPPQKENYDGLEVAGPKSSSAYAPFPVGQPAEDPNIYANNTTILEARGQTDSLYMNTAMLKEETNLPVNGNEHSSVRNSSLANERQDEQDEPQEIYMNDDSQLITATDEDESQEIYVNQEAEEEDIYLNCPK